MNESNDDLQELTNEIIKWNPSELLQIVVIIGSLPQNRDKILRLETLFKLIISLPKQDFQNKDFDISSLKRILQRLSRYIAGTCLKITAQFHP